MKKLMNMVVFDEPLTFVILRLLISIILITSFAVHPSLCTATATATDHEDMKNSTSSNSTRSSWILATCLADYGVNNFTLFPSYHHHLGQDAKLYYTFLDFSISNLRFAQPSVPKPAAIIMPQTKDQLVNTLLCCRGNLGGGSFEIRVRSGGHSYEGTSSVATDGSPFVIIDLMNLNRISVDLESQTAWVGGGATLGQTYYAISEASRDRGFSAGSCPTVGVGGHISGGGFGFLSRKYGVAADNVEDALLVDAAGRVLDREAMGEEVFWAIRGGGGGIWGIIYAWKIKLVEVPRTVTAFTLSRPGTKNYVGRLVEKWQHVAPKLSDDFYLSVSLASDSSEGLPPTIQVSATFDGLFLGTKREALSALIKVFPELRLREGDCKEMSWIESVIYFSGLEPAGNSSTVEAPQLRDRYSPNKSFFKAKSDYVRAPISSTGIRTALDMLQKEPKGYVILDPYGGFMERTSSESIAFPHRRGNLFSIQYMVDWEEKDDHGSNGYIHWIRGFYSAMAPFVSSAPRAAYVNYLDLDLGVMNTSNNDKETADGAVERARAWGEKYFLGNYDRLVKAKTRIDPLNVFRNQQGIPPLPAAN
ncbi:berberine bridge enzyme-like D-2 [Coffea arabica]|uniref:Berberine bridge enzyme-like D-2 n=1 Tax=Coffea arabica TaxID=13443 RepID=A0A6P6UX73_COFAR|nr:reticuline oxidase-like [Coffea arabica]